MRGQDMSELWIGDSYLMIPKVLSPFSVHTTITSPPYFGKLSYPGLPDDQLGLERRVDDYIRKLASIFSQVYLATVPGGALLINIGETYNNYSVVRERLQDTKAKGHDHGSRRRDLQTDYREKEQLQIPYRLTKALRTQGWLLRDVWVWDKGRPGRSSKSDRPGCNTESILYLRKPTSDGRGRYKPAYWDGSYIQSQVLSYTPVSSPDHPCPMPPMMANDLIWATAPKGGQVLDPFAGRGTVLKEADRSGRYATGIDLVNYVSKPWTELSIFTDTKPR